MQTPAGPGRHSLGSLGPAGWLVNVYYSFCSFYSFLTGLEAPPVTRFAFPDHGYHGVLCLLASGI